MFRRPRPLNVQLDAWLSECTRAEEERSWPARGLWLNWCDFAEGKSIEVGTPRSFSNELRKRGFPWTRRGCDGRGSTPRTRIHRGIELIEPDWGDLRDDLNWARLGVWLDRYR